MTKNSEDFDRLIKKSIQFEMENSPPPLSTDKAWEQLNARLNNRQPSFKRSRFFTSKLFYAVAIIFISLVIILSPQSSSAYNTLVEVFQKVQENVTQLFIKVGDDSPLNEGLSPIDDMGMIDETAKNTLKLDLADAQKETVFSIKQPKFVPEEYILKDVIVLKNGDRKSGNISLYYEGNEASFRIDQKLLVESFSAGVTIDNDDYQIESVDIHGDSASLLYHKSGLLELVWANESHYYMISGMLSKDEIIKIAKSM